MAGAQLRHGVVADARQVEADLARGKVLDRRIGQRDFFTPRNRAPMLPSRGAMRFIS
jgi:hypothetical protein